MPQVRWNQELINKYDRPAPRYTSYPTAIEFNADYSENSFINACNKYPDKPLSIYVHIPFCHKMCYFCGCNKVISHDRSKVDIYLDFLEQEIKTRSQLFKQRQVSQIHWGGGTPTYLTELQSERLMDLLKSHFTVLDDAEIGIEMDPRKTSTNYLDHLSKLGFNRISIGIQDFNKEVQRLINREQDEQLIFALVAKARELNFASINVDLIYGLPKQTVESFNCTLRRIVELAPDRISAFNFAYMPQIFPAHKLIKADDIPLAQDKLKMLENSISILCNSGFQFIGMDHFAKSDDELSLHQNQGTLHRNFQGYTTQEDCDLIGMGVSAISMLGDSYAQNLKSIKEYQNSITEKGTAIWRGFTLSTEDCLRRDVIKRLVCDFKLDYATYEKNYGIKFNQHFAQELSEMQQMQSDGLLVLNDGGLQITPQGRLLIRNIAFCFDVYSKQKANRFSKAI